MIEHIHLQRRTGVRLWLHYCPVDRTPLEVAHGEACNWCGEREIGHDVQRAMQAAASATRQQQQVPR